MIKLILFIYKLSKNPIEVNQFIFLNGKNVASGKFSYTLDHVIGFALFIFKMRGHMLFFNNNEINLNNIEVVSAPFVIDNSCSRT